MSCGACRYEGAASPEEAQRLRAAAAVSSEIREDDRQLRGLSRRVLTSGFFRAAFLGVLLVMLGVPLILFAVVFLGMVSDGSFGVTLALMIAPALFVGLIGTISVRLFHSRIRALEDACAARVPAAPGHPAHCQLCGGPLSDGALVVRCAYCKTDNLVSPEAMRRVADTRDSTTDVMSLTIEQRLNAVKRMATGVSLALLMAAILAPLVFVVSCLLSAWALEDVEVDLDESGLITEIDYEGQRCIGELDHFLGSSRVGFGGRAQNGFIPSREDVDEADYTFRSPATLMGQHVRVYQSGVEGTVVRLYSYVGSGNYAALRTDDGEVIETGIGGLCLVE